MRSVWLAVCAAVGLWACQQHEGERQDGGQSGAQADVAKTAPGESAPVTKMFGNKKRPCYLLFDNTNATAVGNGGVAPKISIPRRPNLKGCILCAVETYHWNGGAGAAPPSISVTATDPGNPNGKPDPGKPLGPATSTAGQGGAPNVNWTQEFDGPWIPDGMNINVTDGNPATWSQNGGSGGSGFTKVWCEVEQ